MRQNTNEHTGATQADRDADCWKSWSFFTWGFLLSAQDRGKFQALPQSDTRSRSHTPVLHHSHKIHKPGCMGYIIWYMIYVYRYILYIYMGSVWKWESHFWALGKKPLDSDMIHIWQPFFCFRIQSPHQKGKKSCVRVSGLDGPYQLGSTENPTEYPPEV